MSRITLAGPEDLDRWSAACRALDQAHRIHSDLLHRAYMAGMEVEARLGDVRRAEAAVRAAGYVERGCVTPLRLVSL